MYICPVGIIESIWSKHNILSCRSIFESYKIILSDGCLNASVNWCDQHVSYIKYMYAITKKDIRNQWYNHKWIIEFNTRNIHDFDFCVRCNIVKETSKIYILWFKSYTAVFKPNSTKEEISRSNNSSFSSILYFSHLTFTRFHFPRISHVLI